MNVEKAVNKPNGQMAMRLSSIQERPSGDEWMGSARPASIRRRRVHLLISPQLAKLWLDNANTNNRNLSDTTVTKYACDMLDGRWEDNGDAIRFAADGTLLDGQHRLSACVEAGMSFESDVIFGLKTSARGTIDIGRVRTASDIAQFDGVANSSGACALAQLVFAHRKAGIDKMNSPVNKPTKTQVTKMVVSDPRFSVVAGKMHNCGRRLVAPRVMAFCYFLFSEQNADKCDQFFQDLSSGVGLDAANPVRILRERLVANGMAKAKLPLIEIIALIFKAWIAYRDGKQVRVLRWRTTGPTPEPFPSI